MKLKLTAPNGSQIELEGTTEEVYEAGTVIQYAHEQGFFRVRERTNAVRTSYERNFPALPNVSRTSHERLTNGSVHDPNVLPSVPYISNENPYGVRTPYAQDQGGVRADLTPEVLEAAVVKVLTSLNAPASQSPLPALPPAPRAPKSFLVRRMCVGLLCVGAIAAGALVATRQTSPPVATKGAPTAPKVQQSKSKLIPVPDLPPPPQ